jgi:hypothetical protein
MDIWTSGLWDPPKCPAIIQCVELGKPFVALNEVGISREKPIPQVAEEMAKS